MTSQSFSTVFLVDQSPEGAFAAITNVRGWWSGQIEGATDELDAEFTYRYQDVHYSKQRITEFVPNKKVVWHVLDACLNFTVDPEEWTGTEVTFEMSQQGEQTEGKYSEIVWLPEVSSQVRPRMSGRAPQYFRIVTTEVRFTHLGLVPAFECYDKCSSAWSFYINNSLRRLITTGQGEPNTE